MTDKELSGRTRLREAMKLSDQTYLDKYPPIENEVKYSEKYLKYIDRLTKQTKSPFYKYFNTIGKRVSGIAAAMLIAFSCAMTVKAVRESVIEFFTNVYEKFVEIFFDKDDIAKAPETIDTVYILGYVPTGYQLVETHDYDYRITYTWEDSEGNQIYFSQNIYEGNTILDNEESNLNFINISCVEVVCVEKYNMKSFFWGDKGYRFVLDMPSYFSQDECICLIESIVEKSK